MKSLLPWLCVVGLLAALGGMYATGQKKETELAALREDSQQLQKLRAEAEEAKGASSQSQSEELARLRKQVEDLGRLRNEVNQLRNEKQQLAKQLQNAEAQAQGAQSQLQALRSTPPPPAGQPVPPAATPQLNPEHAQALACINNLRLIDGAKQQWALEKQKAPGALMTAADLAPYLKGNVLPVCPAGGVYTLNTVNLLPICSIAGHAIPH